MERPCCPTVVLVLVGVVATPPAVAAAATADPGLGSINYPVAILTQVNQMDDLLTNMTAQLMSAAAVTTPGPTGAPTVPPTPDGPEVEEDELLTGYDALERLPHGRFLSKRNVWPLLPRRLALERNALPFAAVAPLSGDDPPPCRKVYVDDVLFFAANTLDRVTSGNFTPDVLKDLVAGNAALAVFASGIKCSLSIMLPDEATELIGTIAAVQTHLANARAAVTPADVGLGVGSAYMVVLITVSCLMAATALVGLAVLSYRHVSVTSKSSAGATKRRGGNRDAKGGYPGGGGGRVNPAYQPTDPPGSLHQARNERWRRDAELESPHRPPAGSKPASTWGRNWSGVVRDYERARDSVAEPPRGRSPPPRRHSPPPRRHSPPPRRSSPPPRRHSPPPPRRSSPPPRRHSPPPEGGANWAYGPTGRNKSTDSPFASSAW